MQNQFEILPQGKKSSVALGFFDGLHIGHREILKLTAEQKQNGLIPVCFTFSENPKSVLKKAPSQALITNEDKEKALRELGIEHTVFADFESIMNMSAEAFVKEILADRLHAKKLFCGFNYRFGKNGEGDVNVLEKLCEKYDMELCVTPSVAKDGVTVSSTLIRRLIEDGNIKDANELLYKRFGFCSVIEHGKKLGRTLGTPTINQPLLSELTVPRFGVYASAVTLESGEVYCGVTNIGVKPTVGEFAPLCETWMPKYTGPEIYGQKADVRLIDFIRAEKRFSGIDELKWAILDNAKTAEKIFNNQLDLHI